MPKQVDLSDPNLDLTQLCLRRDKEAIIKSIKRNNKYKEYSPLAYECNFYSGSEYLGIVFHKNGHCWLDHASNYDIIYKSDFEAYNE